MSQKVSIFLFTAVFMAFQSTAQLPRYKQWENIYGTGESDQPSKLHDLGNGNYAASGWVDPANRQPDYGHWFTFDPQGQEVKSGNGGVSIMRNDNSGLFFGANARCNTNFNPNYYDFLITKTDTAGQILWQTCLGSAGKEFFKGAHQLINGKVLIFGYNSDQDINAEYENNGGLDAWVLMISQDGTIEWQKNFGGTGNEVIHGYCRLMPNVNLFLISSNSEDMDLSEFPTGIKRWFLVIDDFGNVQSSSVNTDNLVTNIFQHEILGGAPGEIYLIGSIFGDSTVFGNHNNSSELGDDGIYTKINYLTGELIDSRFIGGSGDDYFDRIYKKKNGNLILGGITESIDGDLVNRPPGASTGWIVEMDTLGNIVDQMHPDFGASGGGYKDFLLTEEDEIILLSENRYKDAFPEHYGPFDHELPADYYIFKLGYTPNSIYTNEKAAKNFQVHPNPSSSGWVHSSRRGNYELKDLQGRTVKRYFNTAELNVQGLNNGVYLLKHQDGAVQRDVIE